MCYILFRSLGPWRPQVTASSSCSLAWSWSQRLICCEEFLVRRLIHLFLSSLGIGPLSSLQLHFVLSTGDLYKHFLYQLSSLSFLFQVHWHILPFVASQQGAHTKHLLQVSSFILFLFYYFPLQGPVYYCLWWAQGCCRLFSCRNFRDYS